MITGDDIRHWLMQQPRPIICRVTTSDGAIHEVQCGHTAWTKVGDTIYALRPELLEALTGDGKMIRAVRPNDPSTDWGASPGDREGSARMHTPVTDIPIAADPETARFVLFARLHAEAYKHATEVAFTKLVELVDGMARRSESVERARDLLHRQQVRNLEDQLRDLGQEPQGDMMQQMLGAFMGGAAPPPASPPTNGNGKIPSS